MFAKSELEKKLDAEIEALLDKLEATPKDTKEYAAIADQLTKLHKLKTEGKSKRVSPDTVLIVAANIFGILWLARYEKEHVIRGKSALPFVMKPR